MPISKPLHWAWLLLAATALRGQAPATPVAAPEYSQGGIRAAVEDSTEAWDNWQRGSKTLEERVFKLPMADARQLVQKALLDYVDFLDKRRAYSQAVAAYIEKLRSEPNSHQPLVTQGVVYQDQVQTLGVNLSTLQGKLNGLRGTPEWVRIRRDVQAAANAILKLQDDRRAHIPIDSAENSTLMSSILYRDAERQLVDVLHKLWAQYYQALIDAVEQSPGGSIPLVSSRSQANGTPAIPDPHATASPDPLVGVWTYLEGSQQFNGLGEPRNVLLELWMENGQLAGRYRAELLDFSGQRKIDVRLRSAPGATRDPLTLEYQLADSPTTGQIVIEGPKPSGLELMLVHNLPGQNGIPRGRELLHRR